MYLIKNNKLVLIRLGKQLYFLIAIVTILSGCSLLGYDENYIKSTTSITPNQLLITSPPYQADIKTSETPPITHRMKPSASPRATTLLEVIELDLRDDGWFLDDITFIEKFKNLKRLDLRWNKELEDISVIRKLDDLEELLLEGTNVTDLSPLSDLKKLKKLNIGSTGLVDINALSNLTTLEELYLGINPINNINALVNLANLTKFSLNFGDHLTDINPLRYMINLKELDLIYNEISDIRVVSNLESLEILRLCNNRIVDLTPLRSLKNILILDLNDNDFLDISPLFTLASLQKLVLVGCDKVKPSDVEALRKALPNCKIIYPNYD